VSLSDPFIRRPVATSLLTLALALAGGIAYFVLPVSPLPQVEFPTISVNAALPGASPETMASAVATPLERQFGRIAGITEMTSTSNLGSTSITMQFDLSRNIDAAARDVQAAINAAAGQLPANLPTRPNWRKVNPADAPVMILSITSDTYDKARMYDAAASILQQKLAQVEGVGQVTVGGGALPAVRVEVNPMLLNGLGLGLADVRTALAAANANRPKGDVADDRRERSILATDQLLKAKEYEPLVVAYRNGAAVRLSDVATVSDSVEDVRTGGLSNGKPAVSLVIFRQPGANIIATVDRIRAVLPELRASIPAGMALDVTMDRTTTIRASVEDTQWTLLGSIALVILVVFVFLRDLRTTLIPSLVVPISLIGTFAVMYLCGYSIDNLSLMALTIATGFVVDDAIVVIENITRYVEEGMSPMEATVCGAREIGFTVVSMSASLVAVFIPILLMTGIVGRIFREFAVTLSVAIGVSLIVSLTTTPMMCARLLRTRDPSSHGRLHRATGRAIDWATRTYERTLRVVLRHPYATLAVTLATIALNVYLYSVVPKGFFPQQDTGRLSGNIQADQDTSSQAMQKLLVQFATGIGKDPAVDGVIAFTGGGGGGTTNTGRAFVTLKPLSERKLTADQVIARMRGSLASIPGATLFLQPVQDLRIGGMASNAQFQYTLQGEDLADLQAWSPRLLAKMKTMPGLVDVNSNQQISGLEARLTFDRATASRLGITPQAIDEVLYDAFGQRQVSTMYTALNQYHVVMEVDPRFSQDPDGLRHVYVKSSSGTPTPLSAFATYEPRATALSVNHQSQFPAVTISFNLKPGTSLGTAVSEIEQAGSAIGMPSTIHGKFSGTAQAFQDSLANEPVLIAAALLAVYIVLGMLYESLIHPITILSTLPSAGVGALLALLLFNTDLSVIALIGIILLIGIVKKNAILMIDFAVVAEREGGLPPAEAVYQACVLRFRPITMTTLCAMLGALPLALGTGVGSELRRPLGIAIVGGLIVSQAMTLYTTPVIYLLMDRLRLRMRSLLRRSPRAAITAASAVLFLMLGGLGIASCKVGPDYERPALEVPKAYGAAEASTAAPDLHADWWTLFGDAELTNLEEEAVRANQDLQAAASRVAQARSAARIVASAFYPVVTFDPSVQREHTPTAAGHVTATTAVVPFDVGYEIDVWGRVRREHESALAHATASADDFAVVLHTLTADVAANYFNLRALDTQERILTESMGVYRQEIDLTRTKATAGIVGQTDVYQAETLYQQALAVLADIRRQRAESEHAIAIRTGRPPSEVSIEAGDLKGTPPVVPSGLPADLLRQRPDVHEAEQILVAANADVGVATADYYPSISLSGAAGWERTLAYPHLDSNSTFWAFGASVSLPIFEGGKLDAQLEQARARRDELAASFRSAFLAALRDVEDSLSDLHHRADAADAEAKAVESSRGYLDLSRVEYDHGIIGYLQVLDAEKTLLTNEIAEVQTRSQRYVSTVLLIKALGGGWTPEDAQRELAGEPDAQAR
jgi:multidrug efflux pump